MTRGKTAPPAVEEIAPFFPEFEILEILGVGGMGVVYKARQPQLDRLVALKILSHDLASDPAFAERFNREARVLARLSHPNIVGIFDFGTAGPYCYLLMEYVDGVNLRQAMQAGRFTPTESLAMVTEICSALKFAHEEGILHRDIKPENILLDSKGRVKIADFGIAKLVGEDERADVTLTMQGSVLGSPHYMSPEQIETPGDVDQRADIYSLGVVLYEMLTGELPIGRFALPSEKAAMDARIDEIVLRTLAKERQARFQSAQEMSTQVDAVTKSPAPVSSAGATPAAGSGTARFSLLSGILTAISLIFGFIMVYLFSTHGDLDDVIRKIGAGWTIFNLAVTFVAAAAGFLFGAASLGEIRKSGGTKDGLGFAVFAAVTWPILCLGLLVIILLKLPMPGGRSIGIPIALLLTGVPYLLAIFALIRGLILWATGVEKNGGSRHFPGLTRTVLATLGLACLGPVLASIVPVLFPDPGFHDRFGAPGHPGYAIPSGGGMSEDGADWINGHPEITFSVQLEAGLRANFLLLQRNEKGGTDITTIGQVNARSPETVIVKVGSISDGGSAPEIVATLRTSGQYFEVSTGTDSSGWDFFANWTKAPVFSRADRQELELANRANNKDGLSELLYLVVETTPLDR